MIQPGRFQMVSPHPRHFLHRGCLGCLYRNVQHGVVYPKIPPNKFRQVGSDVKRVFFVAHVETALGLLSTHVHVLL